MESQDVNVRVLTVDDAKRRREEILRETGYSAYELLERESAYELTLEELEVVRELRRLEFLIA
ncbi:hypothetical protein [Gulosibacter sediminis]|uniref:hypothetical protein n=1 Tax=Gulosibacter sediminis TaxID=1729695 RepID=UPI0024AD711A|nr:hypothetical protein [Gulosibacter sediminis]